MKYIFVFDKRTIRKIEAHGLTQDKVSVALSARFYIQRSYGNKYFILCEYYGTIIKVIVVYIVKKKHWKIVTSYKASETDKKLYRRRIRK